MLSWYYFYDHNSGYTDKFRFRNFARNESEMLFYYPTAGVKFFAHYVCGILYTS